MDNASALARFEAAKAQWDAITTWLIAAEEAGDHRTAARLRVRDEELCAAVLDAQESIAEEDLAGLAAIVIAHDPGILATCSALVSLVQKCVSGHTDDISTLAASVVAYDPEVMDEETGFIDHDAVARLVRRCLTHPRL